VVHLERNKSLNDLITAVGLMMIMEGIPYFIAPDKMRHWIMNVAELSDESLRRTGLVLMAVGLGVVYMVRS